MQYVIFTVFQLFGSPSSNINKQVEQQWSDPITSNQLITSILYYFKGVVDIYVLISSQPTSFQPPLLKIRLLSQDSQKYLLITGSILKRHARIKWPKLFMSEEHPAFLKMSNKTFSHRWTSTSQPALCLLDNLSKKIKQTTFFFEGGSFQLDPSLCAIQRTVAQIHCHSAKVDTSDIKYANCFRIITPENISPCFPCYCIINSLDWFFTWKYCGWLLPWGFSSVILNALDLFIFTDWTSKM